MRYGEYHIGGTSLSSPLRTFDFPGLAISTTPGYDNTTGLGVPNGLTFLQRI